MVYCQLCDYEGVDIFAHIRREHESYDDWDRWPDKDIVVVDLVPTVEDVMD
jgi:hypothetical protein